MQLTIPRISVRRSLVGTLSHLSLPCLFVVAAIEPRAATAQEVCPPEAQTGRPAAHAQVSAPTWSCESTESLWSFSSARSPLDRSHETRAVRNGIEALEVCLATRSPDLVDAAILPSSSQARALSESLPGCTSLHQGEGLPWNQNGALQPATADIDGLAHGDELADFSGRNHCHHRGASVQWFTCPQFA